MNLDLIISKIVIACLVMGIAEIFRRRGARPSLCYLAWLTSLLILVTPSAISIPLSPFAQSQEISTSSQTCPTQCSSSVSTPAQDSQPEKLTISLIILWLLGTSIYLGKGWQSSRRLRFLVKAASPAPLHFKKRAAVLAQSLSITKTPRIAIADGNFSPFLCCTTRTNHQIVFPKEFLAEIDNDTFDSIALHELIHLKRKDCWRHIFDNLIVAIWWWFPGSWLARKRLREAEEKCVDEMVITHRLVSKKAYANAFLNTVDFMGRKSRSAIPSYTESAFVTTHQVSARINAILQSPSSPRKKSVFGMTVLGLSIVSLCLLSLLSFSVAGDHSSTPPFGTSPVITAQPAPSNFDPFIGISCPSNNSPPSASSQETINSLISQQALSIQRK